VSKELAVGFRGDIPATEKRERSVEQAGVEIVLCMGDAVMEPQEIVRVDRVPVPDGVEPVPAVERGEIGRRADRLVPLKKARMRPNIC
jgi:hypothetical protein